MKYSFPADFLSCKQSSEDYQAEILVSLREESPNAERSSLVLEVRDNGQGFPDDFDLDQVRTLGLRLVKSLVGQLHGSLEYSNQHGASFRIWFPSYR
jgi:two-component sensor histidine kinase